MRESTLPLEPKTYVGISPKQKGTEWKISEVVESK